MEPPVMESWSEAARPSPHARTASAWLPVPSSDRLNARKGVCAMNWFEGRGPTPVGSASVSVGKICWHAGGPWIVAKSQARGMSGMMHVKEKQRKQRQGRLDKRGQALSTRNLSSLFVRSRGLLVFYTWLCSAPLSEDVTCADSVDTTSFWKHFRRVQTLRRCPQLAASLSLHGGLPMICKRTPKHMPFPKKCRAVRPRSLSASYLNRPGGTGLFSGFRSYLSMLAAGASLHTPPIRIARLPPRTWLSQRPTPQVWRKT